MLYFLQLCLLLAVVGVANVAAHGAMTYPRPRNALDGDLPQFKSWAYPCDATHKGINCTMTFCGSANKGQDCRGACAKSAHDGIKDSLTAANGQSCYWFSNGCMVGCDKCDGTNNHFGHGSQTFLYKGMTMKQMRDKNLTIDEPWNPPAGAMVLNPTSTKKLDIKPNCANPVAKPTVCDPRLRTMNTQAECGSPQDVYYYSPWRAPGVAPVIDACGVAGGRIPGQGWGAAGADYMNTSLSKQGDLGSSLPPMPAQASWKAGTLNEVAWTVSAHHGGGYAYRLAPADGPLTEEAFRKLPLAFEGNSMLRWGGNKSSQLEFDPVARGWQTSTGTVPAGSTWRKFPIPTVLWEREGPSFEPVCDELESCKRFATGYGGGPGSCLCSGHSNGGPLLANLEVVDNVMVPAGLAAGKYVLQWRWDCEETDQIWLSCADIEVTA